MIRVYTIQGMVSWTEFRTLPAAASWTGQGTIDDPWVIAPADDVWGWFAACVGPNTRRPWEVSLEFYYTRSADAGVQTTMTVTAIPAP